MVAMIMCDEQKINHRSQLIGILMIEVNAEALRLRLYHVAHIVELPYHNLAFANLRCGNLCEQLIESHTVVFHQSPLFNTLCLVAVCGGFQVLAKERMCESIYIGLHLGHCGTTLGSELAARCLVPECVGHLLYALGRKHSGHQDAHYE